MASNTIHLYRYLLRTIKKLPKEVQGYYKHHVKQGYNSHSDETDPKRIEQIIIRAKEDAEWIQKKYLSADKGK